MICLRLHRYAHGGLTLLECDLAQYRIHLPRACSLLQLRMTYFTFPHFQDSHGITVTFQQQRKF